MSKIRTLLTIVTEKSIEKKVCNDLETLGAKGYTVMDARGKGTRGARAGEWDFDRNIHIEALCSEPVARAIEEHMQTSYFNHFAMIIYSHEVSVMRSNKF